MSHEKFGYQPLDEIMTQLGISNSDLVRSSAAPLTHKMVQKARKGTRRLTPHIKQRILDALNTAQQEHVFTTREIFNY